MRTLTSLLAVILIAVVGWGAYQWQRTGSIPGLALLGEQTQTAGSRASGRVSDDGAGKAAKAAPPRAGAPKRPPTAVTVVQARGRDLEDVVSAVGSLLAAQSVLVKPEIAGRIDAIGITDGQAVAKGADLFRLDASVFEAELAQARAELALARSNLKRTTNLASQAFVSERSRDEALSNVRVLEARLRVVQVRLDKTRIRAPFDGVVGLLEVSLGDYVQAGTVLVRIDDLSSMKLDFRVPERLFSRLRRGQVIRVGFDAYPGRQFDAAIETIDARLDGGGRSVIVRGRLANPDGLLRPGMFARARLVLGSRKNAVMVPESSVVPDADGQFVYKVDGAMAQRTRVQLGLRQDGLVEVTEGLSVGETIVLAGQINLRGATVPVRIVQPEAGTQQGGSRGGD